MYTYSLCACDSTRSRGHYFAAMHIFCGAIVLRVSLCIFALRASERRKVGARYCSAIHRLSPFTMGHGTGLHLRAFCGLTL